MMDWCCHFLCGANDFLALVQISQFCQDCFLPAPLRLLRLLCLWMEPLAHFRHHHSQNFQHPQWSVWHLLSKKSKQYRFRTLTMTTFWPPYFLFSLFILLHKSQIISISKSCSEKEWRADTDKPPIVNDGNPVTKKISFIHEMCGQYNGTAFLVLDQKVPDWTTGIGVHTCCRLVEDHSSEKKKSINWIEEIVTFLTKR